MLLPGRAYFCALLVFAHASLHAEHPLDEPLTQNLALLKVDSHNVEPYVSSSSHSHTVSSPQTEFIAEFPSVSYQGEIFEYDLEQALVMADDEWGQFDPEEFKIREAFITQFF